MRVVLSWVRWPLRLLVSARAAVHRGLSPGAVTAGLAALGCCNVIWGYPLSGFLSAFLALLLVAWCVNRLLAPRLRVDVVSRPLTRVQQVTRLTVTMRNTSRLPTLELLTQLESSSRKCVIDSTGQSLAWLPPGEGATARLDARWTRRGIRPLPSVRVTSRFPLGMFRASQSFRCQDTVAVAPARLDALPIVVEKWLAEQRVDQLDGGRIGDSYHYIGSREYQPAVAVRRWDFASWARLGRPIVREFEQPSRQAVWLVVDTFERRTLAHRAGYAGSRQARATRLAGREEFEFLLQVATTILERLAECGIAVRLVLAEQAPGHQRTASQNNPALDVFLSRLAAARPIDPGRQEAWLNAWQSCRGNASRGFLLQSASAASSEGGQTLASELRRQFAHLEVVAVAPAAVPASKTL